MLSKQGAQVQMGIGEVEQRKGNQVQMGTVDVKQMT